jgi:hypothetical protein
MAGQVMSSGGEGQPLQTVAEGQPSAQSDKRPPGWAPLVRYLVPGGADRGHLAGPPQQVHGRHDEPGPPVVRHGTDAQIVRSTTSQDPSPAYSHKVAKIEG